MHWEHNDIMFSKTCPEIGNRLLLELLRNTFAVFENLRTWSCHLWKSWHSQDKNVTPLTQKQLAGIHFTVAD